MHLERWSVQDERHGLFGERRHGMAAAHLRLELAAGDDRFRGLVENAVAGALDDRDVGCLAVGVAFGAAGLAGAAFAVVGCVGAGIAGAGVCAGLACATAGGAAFFFSFL